MAQLGQNLFTTLDKLEELINKTPPGTNRVLLKGQYDQLCDQAQELVDANVRQATTEYNAAINILNDANKKIQDAIDGVANAIEIINKADEAIAVIGQLLAKVAVI